MPKGHCNCGAVAFEVAAARDVFPHDVYPHDVYHCHCSVCRRFSGTHGAAVIVVANADFQWTKGQGNIKTWAKPDVDWQAHFCATCGSALPGPNDPNHMFIPAGSLSEGADQLRTAHHIWTDSRAPWVDISDDGTQHPRGFGTG